MIRIVAVDSTDEKTAALLHYLQLDTLPDDTPYNVRNGHWWIAYEGELAVGFAGISQSVRWTDTGYLCRAGVIRSHRGKGLQKRLIRVREAKARRIGWKWLITETANWNVASANSLLACGYKLFTPTHAWGVEGALYWRKKIEKEDCNAQPGM